MALEHVRTWRVGDVEISRIVEVNGFADDLSTLLKGGGPEDLARHPWLAPHFADPTAGRVVREGSAWKLDVSERAWAEA